MLLSRAREEQLWEQQRIVTQLKRNLRHAKSAKTQPPAEQDYEEELNFALQTPMVSIRKVSMLCKYYRKICKCIF